MKKNLAAESVVLAQLVSGALEHLDKVETGIVSGTPTLTSADKKRSTKPRKGGEHMVGQIASIMKAHGMDAAAFGVDAMVDQQDIANKLAPLEAKLTKLLAQVTARRFEAGSAAWQTALECYSLLQRRAQRDGSLAENLAPIEAFFAYRHIDVLDTKPTKLQTRANAKLARAETLVAHARSRVGAIDTSPSTPQPAPVATPAQPLQPTQPTPAPAPAITVAQPAPLTQMYVPKANGLLNGANGYSMNGAGGTNGAGSTG